MEPGRGETAQRGFRGRKARDILQKMDHGQADARAEVEQPGHHPRADTPEHDLGDGGARAEQGGGQQGQQDADRHAAV